MWYYELNQQPFGPVSKETIADELTAGRITPQTRVWREGWAEWKKLGETELALLAGITPLPATTSVSIPVYTSLPQYKKVNSNSFTKLFWWWFGLIVFSLPFYLLNLIFSKETWAMAFYCVYEIPVLVSLVLQYVLIYKFWQIVQDGFAITSPGKAVGFLFIPFFNYYWYFVAYVGLAKNQNTYITRHMDAYNQLSWRKSHPAIAIASLIIYLVTILFSMFLMVKYFAVAIASGGNTSELLKFMEPYIWISVVAYILQTGFKVWMYFDFFLTSKSILKAEEN